ncbi:hypothetical protein RFM26_25930 [Mesorhizobium sp. VK23B]|uniref:Glycerophosphoryl diester phosphodiesterase membrane domain-containing protein n=1 Tax=Mesorhizobium dulcispinae TaxID=3072316 RepID=A0ABU4XPN0_9HYPH|nr:MULTISPECIES: hypothetical protein [unclassified Mesorhizobium]MDX8469141.1 hypothetical protein [Mesorhizobium sp. VK23B]MDX8475479.1 hypothetical protein [Mesorhizobium sp. VK23A]
MRLAKVISNTVSFMGRNLILSLVVGALFFVFPLVLVDLWTYWYWPRVAYLAGAHGNSPWAIAANLGSALGSGLLGLAANFVGHAVLSRATIDDINGNQPSIGCCTRTALHHLLPVLGISFAIYLVLSFMQYVRLGAGLLFPPHGGGVVFILLIVPTFIWAMGISVAVPVAIRERLGSIASMSRSRALTMGYRWPIFGLFSIALGLIFLMRVALVFGIRFAASAIPSASAFIIGTIPGAIVSAIVWTVASIAMTTAYVELRRVKEGTSVDELAEIFS